MLSLCTTVISVMIFEYCLWSTFSMSQQKSSMSAYSWMLKLLTLFNWGVHGICILLFYALHLPNEYAACLCQKHREFHFIKWNSANLISCLCVWKRGPMVWFSELMGDGNKLVKTSTCVYSWTDGIKSSDETFLDIINSKERSQGFEETRNYLVYRLCLYMQMRLTSKYRRESTLSFFCPCIATKSISSTLLYTCFFFYIQLICMGKSLVL